MELRQALNLACKVDVLRKLEGSSVEYERGASKTKVEMVAGLPMLGADAVEVSAVVVHASAIRLGVRCYRAAG